VFTLTPDARLADGCVPRVLLKPPVGHARFSRSTLDRSEVDQRRGARRNAESHDGHVVQRIAPKLANNG
jgi:hypothetical protein